MSHKQEIMTDIQNLYLYRKGIDLSTSYKERVAHVLGLDYKGLQDKIARGEIKVMIATGGSGFRDEDPNAVF